MFSLVKSQAVIAAELTESILHNPDFLRAVAKNRYEQHRKVLQRVGGFAGIIGVVVRKKNKILLFIKILALPLLKDLRFNIHCKKRVLFQIT
ncbi:hypothetical protein MHJ94_02470 [Chryseobacterium taklimakanense]|uniref:hypothetical protein n=1 Tax=Chryseobacterium taklimakanense TaxID=536441 RepID=UPI001EF67E4F|nr:hypothetical protein [Chryseobacterium taklimakanense]MCG7280155.1 hypothetical protein [Chryseobacterium taklimakanense]